MSRTILFADFHVSLSPLHSFWYDLRYVLHRLRCKVHIGFIERSVASMAHRRPSVVTKQHCGANSSFRFALDGDLKSRARSLIAHSAS